MGLNPPTDVGVGVTVGIVTPVDIEDREANPGKPGKPERLGRPDTLDVDVDADVVEVNGRPDGSAVGVGAGADKGIVEFI